MKMKRNIFLRMAVLIAKIVLVIFVFLCLLIGGFLAYASCIFRDCKYPSSSLDFEREFVYDYLEYSYENFAPNLPLTKDQYMEIIASKNGLKLDLTCEDGEHSWATIIGGCVVVGSFDVCYMDESGRPVKLLAGEMQRVGHFSKRKIVMRQKSPEPYNAYDKRSSPLQGICSSKECHEMVASPDREDVEPPCHRLKQQ